jgi:hypothetical protein
MTKNESAAGWGALAIVCLAAGCVAGAFFPQILFVAVGGGFVAYVFFASRAMATTHADERVFEKRPRIEDHRQRRDFREVA